LNFVLGIQKSYSSSLIDMNPNPYISRGHQICDRLPMNYKNLR
jgi:hypothetical protein